ncbi:GntR family transcriptional regulator [Euzebya tangerina]|uniref:GntR family transcriptional regulator n=1 Tax=Euzebya tangerina TaxID=591198 RepID=UPI000E30D5A5|nr:GntR family transcriptional regulator [Euzebya tangerina]
MERLSLTDQVAEAIRGEILNGDLAPGHSLREVALSERLDVGRSTVREAIRMLVSEGLVSQQHHRGSEVTRHTPADVEDLINARVMIERHVATVGVGDTAEAERALADLEVAVRGKDWRAAAAADEAFHRALVMSIGSERVGAFHAQLAGEMRLLLTTAARYSPEPDKVAEHARLLELATSGDQQAYLDAAIHHITRSRPTLVDVATRMAGIAETA